MRPIRIPWDFSPPSESPDGRRRPSALGTFVGRQLARLTDEAEATFRAEHPNARERCADCAFRRGTIPNRCLTTVADALLCAAEGEVFNCHREEPGAPDLVPNGVCAGWAILHGSRALADARAPEAARDVIELPPIGGAR